MTSIDSIKVEYPVHYLVWQNEAKELDKAIQEHKVSYIVCVSISW